MTEMSALRALPARVYVIKILDILDIWTFGIEKSLANKSLGKCPKCPE